MTKPFQGPTPDFSNKKNPASPYERAKREWDARLGGARVQARNWRLMAFASMTLAFALAIGLIYQAQQSTIRPYIVEVEPGGEIRRVELADGRYRLTDAQIAMHLVAFVEKVRSKSTDPIVIRENWLDAYKFVTQNAKITLDSYAEQEDPFADIGTLAKTVEVTNVIKISDTTYQVRWRERVFRRGALQGEEHFTGSFSIVQRLPRTDRDLFNNPLGFYIDGLNWSREYNTG